MGMKVQACDRLGPIQVGMCGCASVRAVSRQNLADLFAAFAFHPSDRLGPILRGIAMKSASVLPSDGAAVGEEWKDSAAVQTRSGASPAAEHSAVRGGATVGSAAGGARRTGAFAGEAGKSGAGDGADDAPLAVLPWGLTIYPSGRCRLLCGGNEIEIEYVVSGDGVG